MNIENTSNNSSNNHYTTTYDTITSTTYNNNNNNNDYKKRNQILEDFQEDEEEDEEEGDDDEDEDDDDEGSEEEEMSGNNNSYEEYEHAPLTTRKRTKDNNIMHKYYTKVKLSINNIGSNIWDSPQVQRQHQQSLTNMNTNEQERKRRTVFLYFILLVLSYAMERYTFKVLVDATGPFRLFVVAQGISLSHACVLGIWFLYQWIARQYTAYSSRSSGVGGVGTLYFLLPVADVCIMAGLDSLSLLLGVISGSNVPPVFTVILIQLMLPLSAAFTPVFQTASPSLPTKQIIGASIIFLSVVLGILPAILTVLISSSSSSNNTILHLLPISTSWNMILYTIATIPATISTLYKERILFKYKQPVDNQTLNFILSSLQVLFCFVFSPFCFILLGLGSGGDGSDWYTLYPLDTILQNFLDSCNCLIGISSSTSNEESSIYTESASCEYVWCLLLLHVLSILVLHMSIDKIVQSKATLLMYRGISAGVTLSVITLYMYRVLSVTLKNFSIWINVLQFICTVLVVIGNEIYHSSIMSVDGSHTFETTYRSIDFMMFDDD